MNFDKKCIDRLTDLEVKLCISIRFKNIQNSPVLEIIRGFGLIDSVEGHEKRILPTDILLFAYDELAGWWPRCFLGGE